MPRRFIPPLPVSSPIDLLGWHERTLCPGEHIVRTDLSVKGVAMAVPERAHLLDEEKGCIFCKIASKEAPADIIDENDAVIVFLSLENHPLVVPKEHVPDIYAMSDSTGASVMVETIRIAKAVKKALQCDGIYLTQSNESAAGQDVFHFHLHVYPCWKGKEVKAISRFVKSVTDPENVTREMTMDMVQKVKQGLAGDCP